VVIVFRRVPKGKVVLLQRTLPGDSLGIHRDGNSANVVEVVEDGLAARNGLPLRAQTMDGRSLTHWVLTEVNGRPLNLFFKVRCRLKIPRLPFKVFFLDFLYKT
jgi:hypothetical protein